MGAGTYCHLGPNAAAAAGLLMSLTLAETFLRNARGAARVAASTGRRKSMPAISAPVCGDRGLIENDCAA